VSDKERRSQKALSSFWHPSFHFCGADQEMKGQLKVDASRNGQVVQ
jgi:hypothetical protein